MKLITRHTDYAVSALCYLAKTRKPASVAELSTALGMPYAFLRGILQKLQTSGVLASSRGKSGGFTLVHRPNAISLYALINIFQDTFRVDGCVLKKHPCPRQDRCVMRRKLGTISEVMRREFESVTISSLMR